MKNSSNLRLKHNRKTYINRHKRQKSSKIHIKPPPISPLIAEILENRLLLDASPFKFPLTRPTEIKVDNDELKLFADNNLLESIPLADVSRIELSGSDQNDSLIIDGQIGKPILFTGNAGADRIGFKNSASEPVFQINTNGRATIQVGTDNDAFIVRTEGVEKFEGDGSGNIFGLGKLGNTETVEILTGSQDTLDYSDFGKSTTVNLSSNTASGISQDINNFAGVSKVVGSRKGDVLIAGNTAVTLEGRKGDDALTGGTENDILIGGRNDDTYFFTGDWGTDTIKETRFGGDDALDFSAIAKDITFAFGQLTGTSVVSVISGSNSINNAAHIEKVVGGTGANAYLVSPDSGDIEIDDTTAGSTGTLDLSGFSEPIAFTISENGPGQVVVKAEVDGQTITAAGVEGIIGGAGKDTFTFEGDADFADLTIDGGGEEDTVDFSGYDSGVTVDLSSGNWVNIDKVIGSEHADAITGDDNGVIILGGGGADVLTGGSGDDTFFFAAGWDGATIAGGGGMDTASFKNTKKDIIFKITSSGLSQIESREDTPETIDTISSIEKIEGGKGVCDIFSGAL